MQNHKLNQLITEASANLASDLHLMAGVPPAFRIHGEIHPANEPPLTAEEVTTMAFSLLNTSQREKYDREWGLCVGLDHPIAGRLRATLYRRAEHPELSLRFCGDHIPPRDQLGLPAELDTLARSRAGLLLISGPAGAGKTTTLNYLVELLNRERPCRIAMLEDPIEYRHTNRRAIILQQEIHSDTRSLPAALGHAVRQDADVVAVGELGGADTAAGVLRAAETGHLVLVTLAAPGAVAALERLCGLFEPARQPMIRRQLAGGLVGALAQWLIPGADRSRRVLATEVLPATDHVRELLREGRFDEIEAAFLGAAVEGSLLLDHHLERLLKRRAIRLETALTHARQPARFSSYRAESAPAAMDTPRPDPAKEDAR